MVNTNKLRGVLAENGVTQSQMADVLGITPVTFCHKMQMKKFNTDEIKIMRDYLHIEDPVPIFFA